MTRIIDHHIDCKLYEEQLVEKQIELIGSATTLVIERLMKEFPESIDAQLAHFLKAPIVLDSYNFDPSLKDSKWTEKDLEIYQRLESIEGSGAIEDGKTQFERLFNAITDQDMNLKLGINNLLIKDFKTYFILEAGKRGVGVGTIHVPLKVMLETYGINQMKEAMLQLMNERGLAFYGILTNCRNQEIGEFTKEILLYHPL